jgi:Sulfotransferase domain
MYGSVEEGPEEAIKFYNNWKEEVIRSVPKDRLLIFNVKQGWKPLCDFLDLPTLTTPFPHFNDSQYFKQLIKRIRISAFLMVYCLPTGANRMKRFLFRH